MKKLSEMNEKERQAFFQVKHCVNWEVGGFENQMTDSKQGEIAYEQAKAILENHDELKKYIYEMATTQFYSEGMVSFNKNTVEQLVRHLNFLGTEFIMELIEERLQKEGY